MSDLCLVVHDVDAIIENVKVMQREHSGVTGSGRILQEPQHVALEGVDPRATLLTENGELCYPFVSVAAATAHARNGNGHGSGNGIKLKGFRWAVVQTQIGQLRLKLIELELDDANASPKASEPKEGPQTDLTLFTHVDHIAIACYPHTFHLYARWFLHVLAMHPLGLNARFAMLCLKSYEYKLTFKLNIG